MACCGLQRSSEAVYRGTSSICSEFDNVISSVRCRFGRPEFDAVRSGQGNECREDDKTHGELERYDGDFD
jgi:hypothetical protein